MKTVRSPAANRLSPVLLGACLAVFAVCALAPYDRGVWFAENAPIVLIAGAVAWASRYRRFSNTAYVLMTVLPILHTIGGHYAFERLPFQLHRSG